MVLSSRIERLVYATCEAHGYRVANSLHGGLTMLVRQDGSVRVSHRSGARGQGGTTVNRSVINRFFRDFTQANPKGCGLIVDYASVDVVDIREDKQC